MSVRCGETFRVGLVQLRAGRAIAPNLDQAEALIRQAAERGADYIQTPENTALMELEPDRVLSLVQPEEESVPLRRMVALASDLEVWLHVGSLGVKVGPSQVANRSFLIGPGGAVAARYDKLHMFDVDLPGGESYRESEYYRPGSKAVLADLHLAGVPVRLGMTICYDLRFPALYRALAMAGANMIAVPSAFTRQTGQAHWHALIRARAIETGAFVVAAAQGGLHDNGRETFGHSLIVSPWGDVLAEGGMDPCVVLADVDPKASEEIRARIPSLQHGRPFALDSTGGHSPERKDAS